MPIHRDHRIKMHYVRIDRRGWAQYKLGPQPSTRNPDARRGLPWTAAEDRALLRLAKRLERRGLRGLALIKVLGKQHYRPPYGCSTRLASIRVGVRLAAE